MPSWKERHYARAAEFVQLVANALGGSASSAAASVVPPRPATTAVTSPVPAVVPAPSPPKPVAPAVRPTAGSVFTTIPWKK